MALVIAALLDANLRAKTFWRMGVLVPYVVAPVAVALIFGQMFADQSGLINQLLRDLGIPAVHWHAAVLPSHIAIATMVNFRWTGYNTLVLLAAMQAIPRDLYEAALIDGANRVRQFFSVTIPMLRPAIIFVIITSTIGGLQIFDEPRMFDQYRTRRLGPAVPHPDQLHLPARLGAEELRSRRRRRLVAVPAHRDHRHRQLRHHAAHLVRERLEAEEGPGMSILGAGQGGEMGGTPSVAAIEQFAGKGAARSAARQRGRTPEPGGTQRRPRWLTYLLLTIVVLIAFYPLYYAFLLASSTAPDIARHPIPSLLPGGHLFDNIQRVLDSGIGFWKAVKNSVIIAVITSLSVVLFSTLAGFSFSKLRFRGRAPLLVFVIATTAVPTQLGVVPLFLVMKHLHWIGQLQAVIVPGLVTAFGVFWMTQYLEQALPYELIEAARVDGASMIRTFWSIALPGRPARGDHARPLHVRGVVDELLLAVHHPRGCQPDGADRLAAAAGDLLQGHVLDHGRRRPVGDPPAHPVLRGRAPARRRDHAGCGQGLSTRGRPTRRTGHWSDAPGRARHRSTSSLRRDDERDAADR